MSMHSEHVAVLVVGWGKAGKTLAKTLGAQGQRVALVEADDTMVGGTCINIGCVPTKSLVVQAERRRGDDPASYFTQAVSTRDALVAKMRQVNHDMLSTLDSVLLVRGSARFVAPRTVQVGEGDEAMQLSADTVVIGTGARPRPLAIPGDDGPRVHDSTTLQHVSPLPASLAVIGAGPIGLEFAQMFAGFGSKVVLLDRGERLLPQQDPDVAAEVKQVLGKAGVDIRHGAQVTELVDAPDSVSVRLEAGETLEVDAVLAAVGRVPATDGLQLDKAGVATDDNGFIRVDERLRTTAEGTYAVGDVHGGAQQTYLSLDDFRVVLSAMTDGDRATSDRIGVPFTTFLTPPLAQIGITETEAVRQCLDVQIAAQSVASIAAMPRPKILGHPEGLIKFVLDAKTDLILGATLFTTDAQELINLVALAMRAGVTAEQLLNGIWTHPSSTEALNEVLAKRRQPTSS